MPCRSGLVESIQQQSLRSNCASVPPVLGRYRDRRTADGGEADRDGTDELLATFTDGAQAWSETIGTANRAPGTSVLKSETIRQAAESLAAADVRTAADLRATAADPVRRAEVEASWRRVHGFGKASWDYLLILVGEDGVKADIMVRRFVTNALGETQLVTAELAHGAVRSAARLLDVPETVPDHPIWRFQSGRSDDGMAEYT